MRSIKNSPVMIKPSSFPFFSFCRIRAANLTCRDPIMMQDVQVLPYN